MPVALIEIGDKSGDKTRAPEQVTPTNYPCHHPWSAATYGAFR
jgi:hypothetical protein